MERMIDASEDDGNDPPYKTSYRVKKQQEQDERLAMFTPVLPDELERVKVPTRPIKTKRKR